MGDWAKNPFMCTLCAKTPSAHGGSNLLKNRYEAVDRVWTGNSKPRQNIVYLSAELNRLCQMHVSTDTSIRDLSPVRGLILPLYSVVAHRNDTFRVQSTYFRTSVKDPLARFVMPSMT